MAIVCDVCPRSCRLEENQTGFCGVRKNVAGKNVDRLYGLVYPPHEGGVVSYSVTLPGCNARCVLCDVPFLSRISEDTEKQLQKVSESEVVDRSIAGRRVLTFYGGECTVHVEYVAEASRLCRTRDGVSRLYTNGYVSESVARRLLPAVDQVQVGLKGSLSSTMCKSMGVKAGPILECIKIAYECSQDLWLTNLVGPGLMARRDENLWLGRWLRDNTDAAVRIMIIPAYQPLPYMPYAAVYPPLPGGDGRTDVMSERCRRTALDLADAGLTNVGATVCTQRGFLGVEIPSLALLDPYDFNVPKKFLAKGWTDRIPEDVAKKQSELVRRGMAVQYG